MSTAGIWSRPFWKATAERAISTVAQTEVAVLTAAGVGLIEAPWWASLSASGMAGLLSVLKSIAAAAVTDGSPSLVDAEVLAVIPEPAPDVDDLGRPQLP